MTPIQDTAVFEDLGFSRSLQADSRDTELGQEDFLTLMTTQLRNQDPFKPMENGEFLGQLAQFGAVSGINDLETAFQNLSNSMYSNQMLQAAGMVGRDVLVASSYGELSDGAVINGAVDLPNAVSNLTVGVYDQSGRLVHSIEMGLQPSGMAEFSWDGFTTDGKVTPPGRYEFRSEAVNGGINEAFDVMMATQVQSVSMTSGGGGLSLQLAGLGQVDFSEIRQIR